jgi:hypothetical protein
VSTACLGARKVPADNPIVHGAGEPCKVHQDWIYIQVKVKPAKWDGSKWKDHRQCGNEVTCICAMEVKEQMYYQEANEPNQKLMLSSRECLGMNRPHKTVEYDLDTVLSKENESSPTIMLETETKPDCNVRNRKWPQKPTEPASEAACNW